METKDHGRYKGALRPSDLTPTSNCYYYKLENISQLEYKWTAGNIFSFWYNEGLNYNYNVEPVFKTAGKKLLLSIRCLFQISGYKFYEL